MTNNSPTTPTTQMADSLQEITNYIDALLFEGKLPPAYITLTRNNKVIGGYHSDKQWKDKDGIEVPEIGINSNLLAEGDPLTLYNVLIHEFVHLEQYATGTNGRVGYHNQAFADRCEELGLSITVGDKDAKEGQRTGQCVSTQMIRGGKAELAVANIPTELAYYTTQCIDIDDAGQPQASAPPTVAIPNTPTPTPAKTAGKRAKYTCPKCALNVWGKSQANLICGDCMESMIEAV